MHAKEPFSGFVMHVHCDCKTPFIPAMGYLPVFNFTASSPQQTDFGRNFNYVRNIEICTDEFNFGSIMFSQDRKKKKICRPVGIARSFNQNCCLFLLLYQHTAEKG